MRKFYILFIKVILDYTFSIVLLLALSPLILLCSLSILLLDGGPVIFKQKRIGQYKKIFTIYKFKTMKPSRGPLVTTNNDQRITNLGKFLRNKKFDELPQLFNILRGEMSFIGPRPDVPIKDKKRDDIEEAIFDLKPGITSLSSIQFINESEHIKKTGKEAYKIYVEEILPHKIILDLKYVENASFTLDLKLALKTILLIFRSMFSF